LEFEKPIASRKITANTISVATVEDHATIFRRVEYDSKECRPRAGAEKKGEVSFSHPICPKAS
jgi:hypothetical protein